ncbi:MAG: ribonuclease R [Dongiaceae bacterium]
MAKRSKTKPSFPTREQILEFIRGSESPVGKREVARAFNITGADRIPLKALLKDLREEGLLERGRGRRHAPPETLPEVAVLRITGPDADGELRAEPYNWPEDKPAPAIYVAPDKKNTAQLAAGDRVLARLSRQDDVYEARIIRQLVGQPREIVGVYVRDPAGGGWLKPTDRRVKAEYRIEERHGSGAKPGDLVAVEPLHTHRDGRLQGRVIDILGRIGDAKIASLISIHEHEIPHEFPPEALREAEAAKPIGTLGERTDFRDWPLVTIDGEDARDFDDAVWAERDREPGNPDGWHILVAIADVAHYVRAASALDREAEKRGNSVYFPDRVVPMLPEALSNNLCSLRPNEDRACLAAEMWIDSAGRVKRHKFHRGLMRSVARLTYEQVQQAKDGTPDDAVRPLMEMVIEPLYGAFAALRAARRKRGTLDLEMTERKVILDPEGRVQRIEPRRTMDSHRLIEEFMISANVAAAEALERKQQPVMYRVHPEPDQAKVDALREFLEPLGIGFAKGQVIHPRLFTQILDRAKETPYAPMVNELVLRSQMQATYSPANVGHFGLALPRYAHFTSPIRRYSDLLVHRALIDAFKLGPDGLPPGAAGAFARIGENISATERRAAAAERDAVDRYTASYLSAQRGQTLAGRINGVTRFGLFVTLLDSGGSGLVPISSLPSDFYEHDEPAHRLRGQRWGREFALGEPVWAKIVEADPITGGLILHLIVDDEDVSARPRTGTGRGPERNSKDAPRGRKPAPSEKTKSGKPPRGKAQGGKPAGGRPGKAKRRSPMRKKRGR